MTKQGGLSRNFNTLRPAKRKAGEVAQLGKLLAAWATTEHWSCSVPSDEKAEYPGCCGLAEPG